MIKQALYGHVSMDTAYLVSDYPYGRKVRCRIRYWLESGSKGFRFCSQTENPKTLRWNAPKKSTYAAIAGNMYLDENDYVQWSCITEYTEASTLYQFLVDFPQTDRRVISLWTRGKVRYLRALVSGELKSPFEDRTDEWQKELAVYEAL